MRKRKYLVKRTDCIVTSCPWTFITKSGFIGHLKKFHMFSADELAFQRKLLKEKVIW